MVNMALFHVIKQDTALALSNTSVWLLIAVIGVVSIALIIMTLTVLFNAGYWWLALLICGPLGTGFGRISVKWIRYCRPHWFKPKN